MQLAEQLASVGVGVFPCAVRFNPTKHKYEKSPVTPDRESWMVTAKRPLSDPAVNWQGCTVLGVPVPTGLVIIDGDHYRPHATRDYFDQLLGGAMPWGEALLQTTISGGSHYIFRVPVGWNVRQGSNLGAKNSGLDTRTDKGFICTGEGYTPAGTFGLYRLAYPDNVPELPEFCRELLTVPDKADAPEPREFEGTQSDILEALRFIDPSERDVWWRVGCAIKDALGEDGFDLWDAWSAGQFSDDDAPPGYAEDTQRFQWGTIKPSADTAEGTRAASLFYMAIEAGWAPPARFDVATAFGEGAVSADMFGGLVRRILEEGSDIRKIESLIQEITHSGCNRLQSLLLRNELKSMAKSAGLLDKDLAALINQATTPLQTSTTYDKNHTLNAKQFLTENYPQGTLVRSDQTWYAYDGKSWVELSDDTVLARLTRAMEPSYPQSGAISGTYTLMCSMAYREGIQMGHTESPVVLFQNGVLCLTSGQLLPHSPQYLTTKIVPYDHNPNARAPRWHTFLGEIFENDGECIALLQEWLGYMLSPTYAYQKILVMLGPPRSGKGTIGEILHDLVGSLNYSGASLESFADDDFLDSLQHKTVVFSGDTAKRVSRNKAEGVVERMKKISGCDAVDFGRKYKGRMSCKIPSRITLSCNHVPQLFDDSGALAGRLLVLPFENSFLNREDIYLGQTLAAEIEGIAQWALAGLSRLNANRRFTVPAASEGDVDYIKETYSPLSGYVTACCVLGDAAAVTSTADAYESYRLWAMAELEPHLLSRKIFVGALKDATRGKGCRYGPQRIGGEVVRAFRGLSLVVSSVVPGPVAAAFGGAR